MGTIQQRAALRTHSKQSLFLGEGQGKVKKQGIVRDVPEE